ncbi:glycosyltransferase [Roseomonas aerophila]|uniref:Glycosyltransferase n=1 Tax=Teichococcus aerophilus TaxID=1224513 RepID=A0ABR7RT62_9PROT|nr:glycosyltransferase [Pseudoroseomonas aerophila]MBC9209277.1 glycosyltransferase [Pseudoroseomonas aerophila]
MSHRTCLILHGSENRDLGGPSIRVPKTVSFLRDRGQDVELLHLHRQAMELERFGMAHVFNVWPLRSCRTTLRFARWLGLKTVLSPILLDYSRSPNHQARNGFHGPYPLAELAEIFRLADHIIYLSAVERDHAAQLGLPLRPHSIIHNPVDASLFTPGDGQQFRATFESQTGRPAPERFALSVGRIEPRKNQLALIKSLASSECPLVLIGHEADVEYSEACHAAAGKNVHFLGRLPHQRDVLASAYQAASTFAQVSWSEGGSLAALEAAASGCRLVLSDLPSNREYFGHHPSYVALDNHAAIRKAVLSQVAAPREDGTLREIVASEFGYQRHVAALSAVYRRLLAPTVAVAA